MAVKFLNSLFCLFLLGLVLPNITLAQDNIDSLLLKIDNYKKDDTVKVKLYNALCKKLIAAYRNEEVNKYADSCYNLSVRINYQKGKGFGLLSKGVVFNRYGTPDLAIDSYNRAKAIFKKIGYLRGVAESNMLTANAYFKKNKFDTALVFAKEALQKYADLMDQNGMARVGNTIGGIYQRLNNYPEAILSYQKTYSLAVNINDKQLGAVASSNLGSLFREQGNFIKSYENYSHSVRLREEIGDPANMFMIYIDIGEMFSEWGKNDSATKYLYKSLDLAQKYKVLESIMYSHESLTKHFKHLAIKDSVLVHQKIYDSIKDSVRGPENARLLEVEKQKYRDAMALDEKNQKRKRTFLIVGLSSGVILIVGFILFLLRRKKRK